MKKKRIVLNDKDKIASVIKELDEKKNEALRNAWKKVNKVNGLFQLTKFVFVRAQSFKRLDIIKIKNRRALKASEEEFQRGTACIVSKNHETSFYIVTQTFAVDFDRCMVGSLKRSSCAVEHMRASLNRLLT